MKKILFILLTTSVFISNAQNKNALLPDQLVIYDRIRFDTIPEYHLLGTKRYAAILDKHIKFENMTDPDVNDLFVRKLTKGDIPVYSDYAFYDPGSPEKNGNSSFQFQLLAPDEIKHNMGYFTDSIYVMDVETGETKPEIRINEIDKNELLGFAFYDEWFFDEANFKMTKKVKAYSPVRIYFREDDLNREADPLQRMIGFIIFPEKLSEKENVAIDKRMKLFKKTEYEFLLENEDILFENSEITNGISTYIENINTPLLNSYSRSKFINMLFAQVLSGKSEGVDYETGTRLNPDEIRKRAGERIDTLMMEDPENYELLKEVVLKTEFTSFLNEIKSIIFIEEWYIDEKTLQIKKVVKGVVPVRWYYNYEDYEQIKLEKIKLFQVNFNQ